MRNILIAGGVITLDKSYMNNGGAEVPLEIPANKDVTLDLNGCNIDRGLAEFDAHTYGYVIINNGTLTIKDTSNDHDGKITGANNSEHGGGILNNGTLILKGGSIDGNTADLRGGAIYNAKSGSVTMTGGIISNHHDPPKYTKYSACLPSIPRRIVSSSASRRLNLRACWSAAGVFLCSAGGKATLSGYSRRATLPAG